MAITNKIPTWEEIKKQVEKDLTKSMNISSSLSDVDYSNNISNNPSLTWDEYKKSLLSPKSQQNYFSSWDDYKYKMFGIKPEQPKIEAKIPTTEQPKGPSLGSIFTSGLKKGTLDTVEGLINFGRVVTQNLAKLFGMSDDEIKKSDQDITTKMMQGLGFGANATKGLAAMEELSQKEGALANQTMQKGNILQKGAAIIGETIPQVASLVITRNAGGSLTKALNLSEKAANAITKAATYTPIGIMSGGQYARQAENEGANLQKQLLYGIIGGAAEAITEMPAIESALTFGKTLGKNLLKNGAKTFTQKLGETGLKFLQTVGLEAAQEGLVDIPTGIAHKLIVNPQQSWVGEGGAIDPKQMWEDAKAGAIMGLVFAGLGLPESFKSHQLANEVVNEVVNNSQKKYKPIITQGTWKKLSQLQDTIQEEVNNNPQIVVEHLQNQQMELPQTQLTNNTQAKLQNAENDNQTVIPLKQQQTGTAQLTINELPTQATETMQQQVVEPKATTEQIQPIENPITQLEQQKQEIHNEIVQLQELRDTQGVNTIPDLIQKVDELIQVEKQKQEITQQQQQSINIETQQPTINEQINNQTNNILEGQQTTNIPEQLANQTNATVDNNNINIPENIQQQKKSNKNEAFTGRAIYLWQNLGTGTEKNDNLKHADEIIKMVEKRLGVPIKKGKINVPRAEGLHKPHEKVIRIRNWNDIPVLSHELGHYIMHNVKMDLSPELQYKIMEIGDRYYQDINQNADEEKKFSEGFAEFVRQWLFDELPIDMSTEFEKALPKEIKSVLDIMKKYINEASNADAESLVGATISDKPESKIKPQSFDNVFQKFMMQLVDKYYPIQNIIGQETDKNRLDKIITQLRGAEGQAYHSIQNKQIDLEGNIVGKGLQEILSQIKSNEYQDFVKYIVSKAAEDYKRNGMVLPLPYAIYEKATVKLENKYKHFTKVFNELREYANNQLDMLEQSGLYSKEDIEIMKTKYQNYMPFYRDMTSLNRTNNKSKEGRVIKQRKGGGEDIIDPIESLIMREFWFRRVAHKNRLYNFMTNIAENKEGLGEWIEKVPPSKDVTNVPFERIIDELQKQGIEISSEDINKDFITIFKADYTPRKNEIIVYKNGKPTVYELNDILFNALHDYNMPEGMAKIVFSGLNYSKRILQTGVVTSDKFIIRNILRDFVTSLVYSKTGLNPIDIIKGYISSAKKDEWYYKWLAMGGSSEWFNYNDRRALRTFLESIMPRTTAQKISTLLKHPISEFRGAIEFTEAGPRIAEFRKAIEKLGVDEDIAAAWARDLTIDFKKAGKTGQEMNKIIPFFNAQVQGLYKMAKELKNPKTWIRATLAITLPNILVWLLCRDNEEYKSMSPWRKYFFLNIPIGDPRTAKHFFSIPMPFDIGYLFGALPIAALDQAFKEDPKAMQRWIGQMQNAIGVEFWNVAGLQTIIRLSSNKQWTGAPIETLSDQKRLPAYRYDEKTSTLAKAIGKTFNISPKKLDYAVKELTGTLGEEIWRFPDIATGKQTTSQGTPIISALVTKPSEYPVEVQDFYDEYKKMEQLYYSSKQEGKAVKGFDMAKWQRLKAAYKVIDDIENAIKQVKSSKTLSKSEMGNRLNNLIALKRIVARKALGREN